ncbi:MAG: ATP-binding protein [Candidatus Thiodiazotropha sp.]
MNSTDRVTTAKIDTIEVTEERHVARARHEALTLGRMSGMRNISIHAFATIISELAYNLVFHTDQGGTIKIRTLKDGERNGIEVICEDPGPGIEDTELALQDGYSTGGGLGGGLPGVRRLANEFEITSTPGVGTRIRALRWDLVK